MLFVDFVAKRSFIRSWPKAWLVVAAIDCSLDTRGTKSELVDRIVNEIKRGNKRVIRRFDRCSN